MQETKKFITCVFKESRSVWVLVSAITFAPHSASNRAVALPIPWKTEKITKYMITSNIITRCHVSFLKNTPLLCAECLSYSDVQIFLGIKSIHSFFLKRDRAMMSRVQYSINEFWQIYPRKNLKDMVIIEDVETPCNGATNGILHKY
jgi:hypothetical protein